MKTNTDHQLEPIEFQKPDVSMSQSDASTVVSGKASDVHIAESADVSKMAEGRYMYYGNLIPMLTLGDFPVLVLSKNCRRRC